MPESALIFVRGHGRVDRRLTNDPRNNGRHGWLNISGADTQDTAVGRCRGVARRACRRTRPGKHTNTRIARNIHPGTKYHRAKLVDFDHQGLARLHDHRITALGDNDHKAFEDRDEGAARLLDETNKIGAADADEGCRRLEHEAIRVDITAHKPGDADGEPQYEFFNALVGVINQAVENHHAVGADPSRLAADKGYFDGETIKRLEQHIETVSIGKKGKRSAAEAAREHDPIYRHAQRFRAGVEGTISFLKRVLRLSRCYTKGWAHFQSAIGASIFGHNLLILARC